ncbi:MAG: hypothetical protein B6241_10905 [Spirochaetaceae bacterium 4572_59]|nr:MAG: hypothetical protein B6241_10905 [Spirochaetaceae bacterium 4572_59]
MIEQKYLKRNFFLNTLDGVSFYLGMIFLSMESVLPVFLSELGASPFWISMIPAIRNIGVFFPSIFVARRIQGLVRKKSWLIKAGSLQRLPFLFSGLFCFYFAAGHPQAAIFSILLAIFLINLGAGFAIPAFSYFTAKTIPVNMRGKLFAMRNLFSYLIGFFCGAFISWIITNIAFPQNYSVLMLIGFAILLVYLPAIGLQKEPDAKTVFKSDKTKRDFIKQLGQLLKNNDDLKNYILGRIFFTLAFASNNYFAVFLVKKYDLHGSTVGLFTIITAGTFLIANPVLGILADRKGHLYNHYLGAFVLILSSLIVVFSPSYLISLSVISLGALALCVQNVSFFSLPMEFGEDHEIPIYVGLVGLFVGSASLLIIAFAFIAERFGYIPIFVICSVCAVLSLFFYTRTTEPRRRVKPKVQDVQ